MLKKASVWLTGLIELCTHSYYLYVLSSIENFLKARIRNKTKNIYKVSMGNPGYWVSDKPVNCDLFSKFCNKGFLGNLINLLIDLIDLNSL